MEESNEDDLIMYEESKEIKENIWNSWDLLNDNQVIYNLLLNSPLINEFKKANSQISINKENKSDIEQNSK